MTVTTRRACTRRQPPLITRPGTVHHMTPGTINLPDNSPVLQWDLHLPDPTTSAPRDMRFESRFGAILNQHTADNVAVVLAPPDFNVAPVYLPGAVISRLTTCWEDTPDVHDEYGGPALEWTVDGGNDTRSYIALIGAVDIAGTLVNTAAIFPTSHVADDHDPFPVMIPEDIVNDIADHFYSDQQITR